MSNVATFALGLVLGALLMIGDSGSAPPAPRETILVGTGCDTGDMRTSIAVAYDEDLMPLCDSIDVHTLER